MWQGDILYLCRYDSSSHCMLCCDVLGFCTKPFFSCSRLLLTPMAKIQIFHWSNCLSHIELKQTGSGVGGNLWCQKSFRVRVWRRITLEERELLNVESHLCIDDKTNIYPLNSAPACMTVWLIHGLLLLGGAFLNKPGPPLSTPAASFHARMYHESVLLSLNAFVLIAL